MRSMLSPVLPNPIIAFAGDQLIAQGDFAEVALAVQAAQERGVGGAVVVSDAVTQPDLAGDPRAVGAAPATLAPAPETTDESTESPRGPGRPKLGVVAREVTMLPRHWDWLAGQPGGASVALRKLVEGALREAEGPDRARRAKEATYRFITAIAGDLPGYEEATRMLFAGDWTAFDAAVEGWPEGVRETARGMAAGAWRNGAI